MPRVSWGTKPYPDKIPHQGALGYPVDVVLGFKAEFDGGRCPRCQETVVKGEQIRYNDDSQPEHVNCEPDLASVDAKDTVLWETHLRAERFDAEEQRVAPLQRPVCDRCFIELPVSMVCGYC